MMNGSPDSMAYVSYHGWVLLKNAINSHQFGLRVQFALTHEDDFKVFKDFTKHRKNRAGSGAYRIYLRPDDDVWGEPMDMLFITWSLSPTNGAAVTFEMSSMKDWEKLRGLPALSAKDEPEKLEIMALELDDNGVPINIGQRAKLEKMAAIKKWGKGGPQSKRAARLCGHTDFVGWAVSCGSVPYNPTPEDIAEWMRTKCEIDTRAQLDHDPAALQRFEDRIMSPFLRSTM
jgi:hypothetical protein